VRELLAKKERAAAFRAQLERRQRLEGIQESFARNEQREALRVNHMAKLKVDADVIKGHRSIVEHFADEDKRREEAERAAYEAALEARRAAKHVATGPEFWAALRDHQAFLRQRRAEADARRQGEAAKFRALQPRPPSLDVTGES